MEKSTEGTNSGEVLKLAPNYKAVLIPVALSAVLGPGAGQLYHREWKKGIPLIVLTLLLLAAGMIYLITAAQAELNLMAETDPERILQGGFELALAQDIVKKHANALSAFKWSLVSFWCLSIVDAFIVGKKRMDRGGS